MDKHCDIIIPVWNNLEITKDCIFSIRKHTKYPYKLVLIDNASSSPTKEYLVSLKKDKDVILIRNEKNLGFIGAVNQGLEYSKAPYTCIMNNDTVATEGWLDEMVDVLEKNKDIGLINPSSNSSCQFPGDMDIHTYALTLKKDKGQFQEVYRCSAFSMIISKEVRDKVGLMDGGYGMGYFDDTDYSKRVQKAGYKTVRAKASYIYHIESQSFSKLKDKNRIFSENEKKFNLKWGRQVRSGYIVPNFKDEGDIKRISDNINTIAKSGHQVWIYTKKSLKHKFQLVDHDSIRFVFCAGLFFTIGAMFRIIKRKKKKNMHIIITSGKEIYFVFRLVSFLLKAKVVNDNNLENIKVIIQEISFKT